MEEKINSLRLWLNRQEKERKCQQDIDSLVLPKSSNNIAKQSFMSLVSEYISVNDASLNIRKLIEFSETNKGISSAACEKSPGVTSFESFSKSELEAAFSLKPSVRHEETSQHMVHESTLQNDIINLSGTTSLDNHIGGIAKRGRYYNGLTSSGSRSRSSSPVPLTGGSTSTDGQSPSATQVRSGGPTSLQQADGHSKNAQGSPPPPLPPGPPPPRKATNLLDVEVKLFFERDDLDLEADDNVVLSSSLVPMRQQECGQIPQILLNEYRRVLKEVIAVKDWPESLQNVIQAFERSGYPYGNPFVTSNSRVDASLSDDIDSNEEKTELDLSVMWNRVKQKSRYRWFYQFENDLRLVATDALKRYQQQGIMRAAALHLYKVIERELAKSFKTLEANF